MNTEERVTNDIAFSCGQARIRGPVVVAYLYNQNGMAAWCWEAAHALRDAGKETILVASPDVSLPAVPAMEVLRIEETCPQRHGRGVSRYWHRLGARLSNKPDGLLQQIDYRLRALGSEPAAYVLNQSSLVDPAVPGFQLVASWAYPATLWGYLGKVPLLMPDNSMRSAVLTTLSTLGWWRKDWHAYRKADRVLAVSKKLRDSLGKRSIPCSLAYPGTRIGEAAARDRTPIRLFIAAARLNEPRKRVAWMLNAIRSMEADRDVVLEIAGEPDQAVTDAASETPFRVDFLGRLPRERLQQVMQRAHVFCFGSVLDDWGYVLVEAMANGLIPVAPAISPFDEILGGTGCCYHPDSEADFRRALEQGIAQCRSKINVDSSERARQLFSRAAFGRSILESLSQCV